MLFPFPDTPLGIEEEIQYIVEPGGSIKDQEVIDAINANQAAMLFTGTTFQTLNTGKICQSELKLQSRC